MAVKFFINKPENKDVKNFFDKILNMYPNIESYGNIMYLLRHNLDPNVVLFCKICHKPLKLRYGLGAKEMPKYCSGKCNANDPEIIKRRQETNIKKYGAKTPMESSILKEKIKATNQERYGTDFPFQNSDIQNKCHENMDYQKRNETTKKTLEEKYGPDITNVSQLSSVKNKKKETLAKNYGSVEAGYKHIFEEVSKTNEQLYGTDNVLKLVQFHEKNLEQSWQNTVQTWLSYVTPLFDRSEWKGYYQGYVYKWKCVKCGLEFESKIYNSKHLSKTSSLKRCPRCPNCYPIQSGRSALEINVFDYIRSIYEGEMIANDRTMIAPKQLDIYLPELHLAFEVDGTYWHSEKFRDLCYHLDKDNRCKAKGITLIHIKEEDWEKNKDIVQNKIKELINSLK